MKEEEQERIIAKYHHETGVKLDKTTLAIVTILVKEIGEKLLAEQKEVNTKRFKLTTSAMWKLVLAGVLIASYTFLTYVALKMFKII